MTRPAAVVLALAPAACGMGSSDDDAFTSSEARFSARFPTEPERVETPGGGVLFGAKADGMAYSVGWLRLPYQPGDAEALDALERAGDEHLADLDATLTSGREVGSKAVEWGATLPDGTKLRARMLVSGRDMYVVEVLGPDPDAAFADFVASFLVLPA